MDKITTDDVHRVEAARIVREEDSRQYRRKLALYNEWDTQVSLRVETQLQRFMTKVGKAAGEVQPSSARERLLQSDDPTKRCLRDHRDEENFRRAADAVLKGHERLDQGAKLADVVRDRELEECTVRERTNSRPVLPVELWAQQHHYASPYGYFAQGCEKSGGRPQEAWLSARRMGPDAHRPDESDGVPAAGKTKFKSRLGCQHNQLGMLAGDIAMHGETVHLERCRGRGGRGVGAQGAPGQDHYSYEVGNDVVECEFPVGKRCFPGLIT